MKKILVVLFSLLFPVLAFSETTSALFTPPSTDYSVIFLGNLFGVVDGILHGTGSQIMGHMFKVMNSAVLALGGIVITYTLIVGTMNTSHEGQFLGQKWSSIWIPVRSTIGLALLIPKASGYCLMQIFIMWTVVQGVGAADKVWEAALNYLNLGGVFVGAQSNPNPTTSGDEAVTKIATGESAMLQGQICMRGVQTILENARASYLTSKESGSGPCIRPANTHMQYFCSNEVPDFLATFNAVEASSLGKNTVSMPNFTDGTMYELLNDMCGIISWTKLDVSEETQSLDYVSEEEAATLNESRPIAVQQMFMDLESVAIAMVNNDPEIKSNANSDVDKRYSTIAQNQYGVPYLASTQAVCDGPSTDCTQWRNASSGNTDTYIFTGLEFMTAMTDYNAIMMPVLNLIQQADDAEASNEAHAFIDTAISQGWAMAGSFFFDLVNLNGSAAAGQDYVDTESGLETATFYNGNDLLEPFNSPCTGSFSLLCELLNKNSKTVTYVNNLITGESVENGLKADISASDDHKGISSLGSASGFGYITNASLINLPGQPGLKTPQFKLNVNIQPGDTILKIPHIKFGCGPKILGVCMQKYIADAIWNYIIKDIVNIFIDFITTLFDMVIQNFLVVPLTVIMTVLNNAVQLLNTSQTHPIVALAFMGTSFINYVTSLYFQLIAMSVIFSWGGSIILLFVLPFLAAWMGVMFTIGFMDAFYVPFLPYMIFTFGVLAWFMAVLEAMVAAPIIALGICNPEGHEAMGKAEASMTIVTGLFLRPAMMILGYIAAISLSYVAVYTLNAGFAQLMKFFMPTNNWSSLSWTTDAAEYYSGTNISEAQVNTDIYGQEQTLGVASTSSSVKDTPYVNYAAMYAGFFCLLAYTTIYLTLVEKCFSLIYIFPDNMMRWVGGQAEQYGKETAQWADATKQQITEGAKETGKASKATSKGAAEAGAKKAGMMKGDKPGGGVS